MSTKDINMRWKTNFKLDIPKFHGGLSSDVLLDWLVRVEKNLEFQSVSDDQLVSLVVEKFRGQAASWWQQVKTTRKRDGKSPIKSWGKLKQKLCTTFLPHHSHSLVYNRLQDLKQRKRFVDYKESYRFQGNDIVHKPKHGIYGDDNDLKQGERFVYGFAENCQFQDNDFVGEHGHVHDRYEHLDQIHDKDGDVLDLDVYNENDEDGGKASLTFNDERPHEVEQELYGPSVFDIYGGRFVEDKTETELVSAVVHTSCNFVLKQSCDLCYANNLEDDVKDDFDWEEENRVVDIEGDDDLDNTNDTNKDDNFVVNQINELIYEYGEDDIDFIGHQRIEYKRLSQNKHDVVITSLDMEEEVSYLGKRNHNYYIFLAHHYRKIKKEPPDPSRSKVLFFRDEEIIEVEVLEKAKLMVPFRHWGLITEDFHVSYETIQKEDQNNLSMSTMEFLNWAFEKEDVTQMPSCPQRVVSVGGANIINHLDFFLTMGALITKKRRVMDIYVVLIYGAMPDVSTLLHHQLFDLSIRENYFFVDRGNHKIKVKCVFLTHVLISYMGVSMDLGEVQIVKVSNASCFVAFAQRLVFPYNSSLPCVFVGWETSTFFWPLWVHNIFVSLAHVLTTAQWVFHPFILLQDTLSFVASTQRGEDVSIKHLGFSIEVTTCLRWMETVLNYNDNDSGELFKTHTSSVKSHLLVIVSSFVIVLVVGDMSKVHLLHHRHDLINVESISCGVLTWVNITVCNYSCYISTTFIGWSDVACELRKLLTCGQLRFILVPFSTVDHFRPCKELPNKLLNMILEIQSSYHIPTTTLITNIEFTNLLFCLLEDNTRRGGANLCLAAECALTHVSIQFFSLSPCRVVYGIFSRYQLALTTLSTRSCFQRNVVNFVDALQLDPTQTTENWEFPSSNCKANLSAIRQHVVFVSGDSEGDLEVDLHTKFKSLCARCLMVGHENIVLRKEMILLKSKMQHIEEKLVCAKEDSKKLKIKLAATHKYFCSLKNEIHNAMQLKAELVAEKETSARLEKELMEYKKNLRMLNSGTKNLDQKLSMGRTGKARFGLGYRGDTYNSKTIFVPENLSKSSRSRERPDSRPNPFPPGGT